MCKIREGIRMGKMFAKRMVALNLDSDIIVNVTGLTRNEVEKL